MRLCIGAVAIAIAGVATYGLQGGFRDTADQATVPDGAPTEWAPVDTRPYTRPVLPTVKSGQPADATGRVPVYREGAQVGWVKPDPARVHSNAPLTKHKPISSTARPKGPKVSSATSGAGRAVADRGASSVWRIKNDFRKATEKPFHKRPSWTRSLNDFHDRRR